MMNPVFILSACAISPQLSFDVDKFLNPIITTDDGKLFAAEPDYRQFINPVAIRRMSRQLKMGIACGMRALQLADVSMPDSIITGTGLGSMTDMEHFLKDMITLEEEALNPTFFIQSTYNSVNGWLALQTKSTGYNQTYVHRGFSIELSLLDAQMFLNETPTSKIALVGSFDELTNDYFVVKSKCDYWKESVPNSLKLLSCNHTDGTIAGEGAAFFALTNKPKPLSCALLGLKLLNLPSSYDFTQEIQEFLSQHGVDLKDIDVAILGKNGDARFEYLYDPVVAAFDVETNVLAFKHLTGEYPTASGFALWIAVQLRHWNQIPEPLILKSGTRPKRNILVINHYILHTASLMLLHQQ
ncbi:MAG: beta-ketoacyl synthase chain length factor [Bacteroidetes bacterium]|nr:beta-ketoacyl synthase chain length factor [Bacteroidota bacterium]MBS1741206.1 beta-ketoacyl synthase chain length factor [Bacteroidota bacterium]